MYLSRSTAINRLVDPLVRFKILFRKDLNTFVLGSKHKKSRTALNRIEPAGQLRGYSCFTLCSNPVLITLFHFWLPLYFFRR